MDVDTVYPPKERFQFAMRLNNLLAAPGFEAWLQGEPLNTAKLLYDANGKPRISVMSIAHLDDAQRMFFVSMLLNQLIGWMRAQQGTGSLRAILYMDEIFGYLPPTANPPSKKLFLTLLKQARAYGLGLVLATQNPVDLDYKALSNAGTWFIGRLQTERDKARVMEGLEGVRSEGFDKQKMEQTLAGLGKRRFLLHSVHEDEAVVFNTRWAMSYLAGPLTRDQISALTASVTKQTAAATPTSIEAKSEQNDAPVLEPSIRQAYLPATGENIVYYPRIAGAVDIGFSSARHKVDERRSSLFAVELDEGPVALDWEKAEPLRLNLDQLADSPQENAGFADCPSSASNARSYATWEKSLKQWLRKSQSVQLFQSKRYKTASTAGESEGEFRIRLQQLASEQRDEAVEKLRKRYGSKATTLENRLLRAEQAIAREQEQSSKKKLDTAVSFGTAILGALLGRKRLTSATSSRVGTAIRSASSARKEASDVARAKETAEKVRADLDALNTELEKEVAGLDTAFDAQTEQLDEVLIKPKATDIHISFIGLVWIPYRRGDDGRLTPAWK